MEAFLLQKALRGFGLCGPRAPNYHRHRIDTCTNFNGDFDLLGKEPTNRNAKHPAQTAQVPGTAHQRICQGTSAKQLDDQRVVVIGRSMLIEYKSN